MNIFKKLFNKKEVHNMDINVINNVPNINVTVNQNDDGSLAIVVKEKGKSLSEYKPGETAVIGGHEFIVLGHDEGTTAVLCKKNATIMEYGDSYDYRDSKPRKYCNGEFYRELVKAIGKDNIISHTVDLQCDDGSNKGVNCVDNVSILTLPIYRRYREFIPEGISFWTATGVTAINKSYARGVCYVNSDGVPLWLGCGYSDGVRPFCILRSSVLTS